jgi:hypothetical protein
MASKFRPHQPTHEDEWIVISTQTVAAANVSAAHRMLILAAETVYGANRNRLQGTMDPRKEDPVYLKNSAGLATPWLRTNGSLSAADPKFREPFVRVHPAQKASATAPDGIRARFEH